MVRMLGGAVTDPDSPLTMVAFGAIIGIVMAFVYAIDWLRERFRK